MSISVTYFTFGYFGNTLLEVGCLGSGHNNAWLSLAGYKYSDTFPFGLGIKTKLLHHSSVSSMSNGAIICCICSHSNSNAYATYHGNA